MTSPQTPASPAVPALSLARRLALAFAALALFAASLTGYFAYRDGRQALVVTAKEQLSTATRVLGRRIALTLEGVERDLVLVAEQPDSARALRGDAPSAERTAELFKRMIANRHAYHQIRLIAAADGAEIVRADRAPGGPLIVTGKDLQEKSHLPYVYETLALPPEGIYVSPASINRERGAHDAEGQPTIQLAMPVALPGGTGATGERVVGVAVITLDLDGLFRLLAIDLPDLTSVYLTNGSGDFLIHPDPKLAFTFDRGQRVLVQDAFPETRALFGKERDEVTLIGRYDVFDARTVDAQIASFVRVDALPAAWQSAGGGRGMQFVLGLAQPLSGVLARSGDLATNAALNALLAGCLAALLAFIVARAATASLRQIDRAMANFGQPGATELPTARKDEIGALARRFAEMQEQIRSQLITLEAQGRALDHEAQHDWLTGLANRRNLIGFLPQALARAARQESVVALFFIDLDGFKAINDTHGHSIGDRLLIEIAERLRNSVRAGDFIARPGGDEFIVVCEALQTEEEQVSVAEKLIRRLSQSMVIDGLYLRVGASVGIARYPVDGEDADTLTAAADRAMYAAKNAGRGTWRFASPAPEEPATTSPQNEKT